MSGVGVAKKQSQLKIFIRNLLNPIVNVEQNSDIEKEVEKIIEVQKQLGGVAQELERKMENIGQETKKESKNTEKLNVAKRSPKIKNSILNTQIKDNEIKERNEQEQLEREEL